MALAAIELQQLWKSYDGQPALQGLSLDAYRGEILGLIGPNGAGKTTTLRILVGLLRPDYGIVRVRGHDVLVDPVGYKAELGYMAEAGSTVLVSTHQLDTAERLCRRVAIVHHGRNVATGDLEALRTAAHTGEEGSLEDVFLRLTQEAAAPAVESPRRRGWFRRG